MRAEGRQWTLYKLAMVIDKETKEKKFEWKDNGFYGNITQVFERCIDDELKLCNDIQEIVRRLKELQEYFKEKLEVDFSD